MRFRRFAVVAGLVVATVGCASAPASPSGEPSPSGSGGGALCEALELRGPNGARVDLTGTWQGAEAIWFITHTGSCVVFEGFSDITGQQNGEEYRFVFTGNVRSDFSIVGRWTWTWACSGPTCVVQGETKSVELRVGFDSEGQPTIEGPAPWESLMPDDSAFTVTLERTSLSTELPDL
jgi:hypothetical protein